MRINLKDKKDYAKINLWKAGRDFAQVQCNIKMKQWISKRKYL